MMESMTAIFTSDNVRFLFAGLRLTLTLAVSVVAISVALGTVLGLLRNYAPPILSKLAGIYIEIFRNTPLLLWMFACIFLVPSFFGNEVHRAGLALILYTASVIAEIVRGGLNSISKGQFEAAQSQGFTTLHTLWYIILPQCFLRIVPSLLSQIVTTIKDTSFLAGFGIMEFTRSGQIVISRFSTSTETFILYGTLALIYFTICFSLSLGVRYWQKRSVSI